MSEEIANKPNDSDKTDKIDRLDLLIGIVGGAVVTHSGLNDAFIPKSIRTDYSGFFVDMYDVFYAINSLSIGIGCFMMLAASVLIFKEIWRAQSKSCATKRFP
jgi:hypothetical protein